MLVLSVSALIFILIYVNSIGLSNIINGNQTVLIVLAVAFGLSVFCIILAVILFIWIFTFVKSINIVHLAEGKPKKIPHR